MTEPGTPEIILDAMQTVIVKHGVHGASLRRVAEEADVSLGLLSYHFANKDALIFAAFAKEVEKLHTATTEAISQSQDPAERVRLWLGVVVDPKLLFSAFPPLIVACWSMALTDLSLATMIRESRDQGLQAIGALIAAAQPDLSVPDAHFRAIDVVASTNGLWLHWARFADLAALERGLRRCEALALDEK